MRVILGIASCLLLVMLASAPAPASAHHAFAAEFDAANCADVTGTMTRVDYVNPHAYIYLDVTDAGGQTVEATFQLSSLSNLRRGGATYGKMTGNIGQEVTVRGCSSRNGSDDRYAASFIRLPDGSVQRLGQDVEGVFGTKVWR